MARKRSLVVDKVSSNRYKFAFETEDGKIVAQISVARPNTAPGLRRGSEKKQEAFEKLKRLVRALDANITED
jgi:hypothetical protein